MSIVFWVHVLVIFSDTELEDASLYEGTICPHCGLSRYPYHVVSRPYPYHGISRPYPCHVILPIPWHQQALPIPCHQQALPLPQCQQAARPHLCAILIVAGMQLFGTPSPVSLLNVCWSDLPICQPVCFSEKQVWLRPPARVPVQNTERLRV